MQLTLVEFKALINEELNQSYRRLHVIDTTPFDPGDRRKRTGSAEKAQARAAEDAEDEFEELCSYPEFQDLDAFAASKLDDEDYTYTTTEMLALARNAARKRLRNSAITNPTPQDIAHVRKVLEGEIGLKYVPREPVRNVRGATSNPHGTHPFAGSGGGGSGFGTDFEGAWSAPGFGGGPGAMGGKSEWKPNDPKNLPMGARRKVKEAVNP